VALISTAGRTPFLSTITMATGDVATQPSSDEVNVTTTSATDSTRPVADDSPQDTGHGVGETSYDDAHRHDEAIVKDAMTSETTAEAVIDGQHQPATPGSTDANRSPTSSPPLPLPPPPPPAHLKDTSPPIQHDDDDEEDHDGATFSKNPHSASDHPACQITLLLATGSRHPYRVDERYLAKRNVQTPGHTAMGRPDPFSISVYTLKELILREWRIEWDAKPASPTSIRLIHLGKLLDDKEPLSCKWTWTCYEERKKKMIISSLTTTSLPPEHRRPQRRAHVSAPLVCRRGRRAQGGTQVAAPIRRRVSREMLRHSLSGFITELELWRHLIATSPSPSSSVTLSSTTRFESHALVIYFCRGSRRNGHARRAT